MVWMDPHEILMPVNIESVLYSLCVDLSMCPTVYTCFCLCICIKYGHDTTCAIQINFET